MRVAYVLNSDFRHHRWYTLKGAIFLVGYVHKRDKGTQ